MQCALGYLISTALLLFNNKEPPKKNDIEEFPPTDSYIFLKVGHSACFVLAMTATNWALAYVSYPVQALAKSCKIVPAMIGGVFGRGKNYNYREYLSAALVIIGTVLFNSMKSKGEVENSAIGLLLLFFALAMDGFNGFASEKVRHTYKPHPLEMMQYCNGYGVVLCAFMVLGNILVTSSSEFMGELSIVWVLCVICGCMSALGQIFIFRGISSLGILTLNIITTSRKMLTVLFSIVLFGHALNLTQVFSLILVSAGVGIDFLSQVSK